MFMRTIISQLPVLISIEATLTFGYVNKTKTKEVILIYHFHLLNYPFRSQRYNVHPTPHYPHRERMEYL